MILALLDPGTHCVVVDGDGMASGTFTLNIEHLIAGSAGAAALPGGSTTTDGNTATTLVSNRTGCSGLGAPAPEYLHYWRRCPSAGSGFFNASTCSSMTGFDRLIYLHSARDGVEIACSDDMMGCWFAPRASELSLVLLPAGTGLYGLYVDGFNGAYGSYRLDVTLP